MSASLYAAMKLAIQEQGDATSETMAKLRPIMLYGLPTVVFLTMFWQVAALQLTFLVAGLIMNVQGLLLKRPGVRKLFGLTPLTKPGATNPMTIWNAANPTAPAAKPKPKAATRQQLVREQAARRMRNLSEKDSRY